MPLACIELSSFDYEEYVKACATLSAVWYVWKCVEENQFRIDSYLPLSQSKKDRERLTALLAWANRTDPDSSIRFTNMKREWHERQVKKQDCNYFLKPACVL